jgi:hypothetical protein
MNLAFIPAQFNRQRCCSRMKKLHLLFPCLGLTWLVSLLSCVQPRPETSPDDAPLPLSDVLITYLASPRFTHPGFRDQILPPGVALEKIDPYQRKAYFSIPREYDSLRLARMSLSLDSITYGTDAGGNSFIGRVWLEDEARRLFCLSYDQLRVDSTLTLRQSLGPYDYEVSLLHLRDLLEARSLYDSPAIFVWDGPRGRSSIANHLAPIALPGEPSLQALVQQILPDSLPPEAQAQRLLDFVCAQVDYEYHGQYEIFMKPHETLLNGKSDCSGKVVLYASLLEQIGHPYLLAYFDGHICVGVLGDFPSNNDMSFDHEGQRYHLAETTVPGFKIGQTRLEPAITGDQILFLQLPAYESKLYHLATGDSVPFLTVNVPANQLR